MAEPKSPSPLSDIPSFKSEWSVLLECASPARVPQCLSELLRLADGARLLLLAEEHGMIGLLTASLRDVDESSTSAGIRQTLLERQRAQNFLTLRLTAELFHLLE